MVSGKPHKAKGRQRHQRRRRGGKIWDWMTDITISAETKSRLNRVRNVTQSRSTK